MSLSKIAVFIPATFAAWDTNSNCDFTQDMALEATSEYNGSTDDCFTWCSDPARGQEADL